MLVIAYRRDPPHRTAGIIDKDIEQFPDVIRYRVDRFEKNRPPICRRPRFDRKRSSPVHGDE